MIGSSRARPGGGSIGFSRIGWGIACHGVIRHDRWATLIPGDTQGPPPLQHTNRRALPHHPSSMQQARPAPTLLEAMLSSSLDRALRSNRKRRFRGWFSETSEQDVVASRGPCGSMVGSGGVGRGGIPTCTRTCSTCLGTSGPREQGTSGPREQGI